MAYESELALGLVPYTAGEQPRERKFIKLNTNENPYPPTPRVLEAINRAAENLRLYPDMNATALSGAIAAVCGVRSSQVLCGNGSDEVLALSFAAFFAGKTLWAPDVTYSFYPVYARLFGVHYREVPLREDFTVDERALMQGGPVALANPNAPTGILLPLDRVRALCAHCREHGAVLLVDEAYAAFAPENALPLLSEFDNLLIVRTFSKSHALAGLRVGYALGDERLIAALTRVRDSFNSYPVDRLAQAAAEAAILDTDYTAQTVRLVVAAREAFRARLLSAGLDVLPSAANFLFVRADARDASAVQARLREEGILVRHFSAPRLRPYLRVTVGTAADMDRVAEALIRLCGR